MSIRREDRPRYEGRQKILHVFRSNYKLYILGTQISLPVSVFVACVYDPVVAVCVRQIELSKRPFGKSLTRKFAIAYETCELRTGAIGKGWGRNGIASSYDNAN